MSRLPKLILCKSVSFASSRPNSHSFFLCRRRPLFAMLKFIVSNSAPETLDGLVDVEAFRSAGEPTPSISAGDFAFLRDSVPGCPPADLLKFKPGKFSDDAISIAKAINESNVVFGEETEKLLRKFRDKLNVSLVVGVLKLVINPQLGVQFFIWAGRQIGYSHRSPVYYALLELIGCNKNIVLPEHFFHEIRDADRDVLAELLNVLIQKCCRNGMWSVALEELGRLKDLGYKPVQLTYNMLIQVFLEANQVDTARLVHDEMSTAGFRMDSYVLGCFAYSLCKAGKWREALDLIGKEEFAPNAALYTQMISGLCEASLFEEAMDFLNRMRCCSCLPNVVTYKALVCACLRKRQLGRCKRILSMMMAEGCYPDREIFNSLVHAYCKSGDHSYAYKLLRKMEGCGCQPGYVVYNILIGGICGNEEFTTSALELAEKVYGEMLNAGLLLNKINVCNFARCLCWGGKFDRAYKVIHEMMSKGFVPDATTYTKVIEFLCNSSRVEKAFLLFKEMKSNGIIPDVYTYSILIDAFCKAGLIVQARKWFDEMVMDGCSPNVVTYTSLIHAYLKVRRLCDADELFETMLSNGCVPNIVTFTALIDGHCKAKNIEKACQIYSRMRGQVNLTDVDMYFRLSSADTSEPNVFTYGALIDGLCKAQKVGEARDLLDAMLKNGCEPNHIVYDALIDGFCKAGKLDEAQEVFSKMSAHGYTPNEYTYGSLIDKMFKDKRLDLALKVLSKMLESSYAPNVVIYTEMVDGLCKVGKTDEAYRLMLMMNEKGCHPNVVTYTAIIDGFGKVGKVDKCLELFSEMGRSGCTPNYVTYRVLINHCCSVGLLDDAHHLLEEMKQMYWPMHVASYQKVIEGFSWDFLISVGLQDAIGENNHVPIAPIYKILIDGFCKAGRLERAVQLYREISSSSQSSIATTTCSLLIKSLCLASKVDEGFELFADTLRRGDIFDVSTFCHLIVGLVRLNRWDEALQLSYSACHMGINWLSMGETSQTK
ncbi:hypothetical protein Nepgr_010552 [Nepenthes gracilis]|uniref:Pentatricopeptide repeat-containing protein n=1 Tax=Nepenthes gracilis TaxID=150966 RepID=A0AAD3XL66_NEPGR|nr:hypothetical protein Nepgr_010552 [Nepenthes gracilis]